MSEPTAPEECISGAMKYRRPSDQEFCDNQFGACVCM